MKPVPVTMKATPRSKATKVYVFPKRKSYPIGDLYHARLALLRVMWPNNVKNSKAVLTAVMKRYPKYDWASWWDSQRKRANNRKQIKTSRALLKKGSSNQQQQSYVPTLKEIAKNANKYYKSKGIDWKVLRSVMKRGMGAWNSGHKVGANSFQWGYARVYSFLLGGQTYWDSDADLAEKLPKSVQKKIEASKHWSDKKTKPQKIVRDAKGRKVPGKYLAGLTQAQKKQRITEISKRNDERKKMEKKGKLTKAQIKNLNRPFKTDKYLKTKPSSYTNLAKKLGIAPS